MIRHPGPPSPIAPLVVALVLAATTLAGDAAPPSLVDLNKATTSPAARQQAIESIPVERLTPAGRAKASWVLENTSVYRRLPIRVSVCDADLYVFLAQHPDVVVNIWETLGVSHLSMRQTGPDTYQVSDDAGTVGTIHYLLRSRDTQVVYIDGQYTGRLLGHHVRGRGIMVLKSGCVRDVEGRCYVSSRLDAFMNVEPGGAEFLTRTFQPLVGKVADQNFIQTADFLGSLSRTAEVNRRGIQRLVARLDKVQPDVRGQFAQLAEQAAQRASKTSQAVGLHEDLEPASRSQLDEPLVARRSSIAKAAPVTGPTPSPTPTP